MTGNRQSATTTLAFASVTTLFFAWGFITSLVDPLVAAVKGIFDLTDFEAQLSASAFFIAYGVISFPAAGLVARMRAVPSVLIALVLMIGGCLIMLTATNLETYPLVLFGLFVMASGITILQVAANPLAAGLGRPERSHFRLTFSQAFNSVGTFIGPWLGATLFLNGVEVKEGVRLTEAVRRGALAGIDSAFLWLAGLIALLAIFIFAMRGLIMRAAPAPKTERRGMGALLAEALTSRWALLGGAAVFLYVGAEVAIGTQMALFLNSSDVLGIPLQQAAKLVSFYWGGAMVGRLVGSALLTRFSAARLLTGAAAMTCLICLYVFFVGGVAAGYAALCIGLFNSIMFPVIFSLTFERSTASEEATSGFLCFSIVGGAALPALTGFVSGHTSYIFAFIVPAIAYALLVAFAIAAGRAPTHRVGIEPGAAAGH